MVTTDVSICNLALSRLSLSPITSLSQATKEAKSCAVIYPVALDGVLEAHRWGFAKKTAELVLIEDETYLDWGYTYEWPDDCLAIIEIANYTPSTAPYYSEDTEIPYTNKIEYDVMVGGGSTASKVIVTNQEDAELIYTARVENAALYSSLFVDALSYRLASELAVSLRADSKLQANMFNIYQRVLNEATNSSTNQKEKDPEVNDSFLRARD